MVPCNWFRAHRMTNHPDDPGPTSLQRFTDLSSRRSPPPFRKGNTMIEVENLSKRYGDKLAVDGLSFIVQPGIVTGFLGPNGAGKSTTMRMIAGLDRPLAASP